MRTVIRVFGSSRSIAVPSSWTVWTLDGITYRRIDGAIIATVDDRRFVWTDDGSRCGWTDDGSPAVLSTSPDTDRLLTV